MAAAISNVVLAAITESRRESNVNKFDDALNILAKACSDEPCDGDECALQTEISRIHLILGDHKSVALLTDTTDSPEQMSDPHQELRSVQSEFNRVSTSLELAGPLQCAALLFQKYLPLLYLEHGNECVVSFSGMIRERSVMLTSRAAHLILLPGDPLSLAALWRWISSSADRF